MADMPSVIDAVFTLDFSVDNLSDKTDILLVEEIIYK